MVSHSKNVAPNRSMSVGKIGFVLTDRCPAACDVCCFSCSPRKRARLPLTVMLNCIEQAGETDNLRNVVFSGGEPFLFYQDVLHAARCARQLGLRCEIVTCGYWAKSRVLVRRRLRDLRSAGFVSLCLSADLFHAQYVPLDRIRCLLSVAYEEGFPLTVSVTSTRSRPGLMMLAEQLGTHLHGIPIIENTCQPVGRAREVIPAEDLIPDKPVQRVPCRSRMMLAIMPDGNAYACGSVMAVNDMLHLGQVPRDSVGTLMDNMQRSPMLRILYQHGVAWFADRIRAKHVPIALPPTVASNCQLCSEILAAPANRDLLAPLIAEYECGEIRAFFQDWMYRRWS